jgi:hypothetical protein
MTGVPESALGQMQPISNTSGVALAIQYQPMMQRYNLKKIQWTQGLRAINRLVLRTLFTFEPQALTYDPSTDGILIDPQTQPTVLDPADPVIYDVDCEWPPPLPVDALIKLNEIQAKMALGLESKRGALKDLGAEFPDEKMQEIFEEQIQDAEYEGALAMLRANIQAAIMQATGIVPQPDGGGEPVEPGEDDGVRPSPGADVGGSGTGLPGIGLITSPEISMMMNELVTKAYGGRLSQRRNPDNDT